MTRVGIYLDGSLPATFEWSSAEEESQLFQTGLIFFSTIIRHKNSNKSTAHVVC